MWTKTLRLLCLTATVALVAGAAFALGAASVPAASGGGDASLTSATEATAGEWRYVKHITDQDAGTVFLVSVTCPVGFRAFSGGGSTSASNLFITDSYRDPTDPRIWYVRWETDNDTMVNPAEVTAVTACRRQ